MHAHFHNRKYKDYFYFVKKIVRSLLGRVEQILPEAGPYAAGQQIKIRSVRRLEDILRIT